MSTYNPVERAVARVLGNYPGLKSRVKRLYQGANYLAFGERGFDVAIHPDAAIETVESAFGTPPLKGDVFFGYFDKDPWSPSGDKGVAHRVRGQGGDDADVVILEQGGSEVVGTTPLWNYQQGAMAQWVPGDDQERVIYNALVDRDFGSRIVSAEGIHRELSAPIQTVHPGGEEALTLNYRRLADVRPEYGYGEPSDRFDSLSDHEDGIWHVDFGADETKLAVSIEDLRNRNRTESGGADHWVNHLLYSPSGERYVFLHRWEGSDGRFSRLYASDGDALTLLLDDRIVSHYCWLDDRSLVVWGQYDGRTGYYIVDVIDRSVESFGDETLNAHGDGHPSISPNGRWLVTDTYPDRSRQRHLLLYDRKQDRTVTVGRFLAPLSYHGEGRCDLHPRWGPNGQLLSIDSAHSRSRESYTIKLFS